ncbi:MAG: zinc ribbon domain-containing protein [Anaerolineales bacterium]
MAETIKCPVCGESNPAGQEFCQFCQSQLQPTVGSTTKGLSPLKPGQAPTKKNTAELEPILPQWLKDARDSARKADPLETNQVSSNKNEQKQPASSEDLLAGLRSQSDENEDDETPDWLASITGAAPTTKKSPIESSEARRVELGGKGDFAQEESEESEQPSWLANLTSSDSQEDEKDELTSWLRNTDDSKPIEQTNEPASFDDTFSSASSIDDTPDWLRQMAADEDAKKSQPSPSSFSNAIAPDSADTPDWLRQMAAADNLIPPADSNDAPDLSIDVPDWLRGMEEKSQSAESPVFSNPSPSESEAPSTPSTTGALPSWLNDQVEETPKPFQDTTPKWLKKEAPASVTGELPAWLSSSEETVHLSNQQKDETPATEPVKEDSLGDLPDWLKAAAPQSTIFETPAETPTPTAEPADTSFDTPDWLNAFKTVEEKQPESAPEPEKEAPLDIPSAFVSNEKSSESVDDLFTEMPDWLSNAMDLPASTNPTPITNTDAIAPGELPSWVQAMRPVDATVSPILSSTFSSDQTLESRGALAGLQGVLPSVPGFTPTSKPKPYSIRLQASEEQQAHAALLEQILAAEASPVPIASFSALHTSRSLRWFLSAVILIAVVAGLLSGTPIFSLPLGVPREVGRAVDISRSLPQGAPVLVAFDVEASRVGEMEAAAAPFFDQMIFYSHPNLTFISTSEISPILAERFIAGPLADHYKNSGFTYSNLGYLSGGQLGIRAFAQNPRGTSPLDMYLQPAWAAQPDNLTSLSQLFIAMVIITDNTDAARAWIEQTQSSRGSMPVIVITSAQAAPIIQPYFDSQQVSGMVAGLYGGAVFEQNNPGTIHTARTYWDAYSIGMLLAVILVFVGSLWNLFLGLRDRSSAREAK